MASVEDLLERARERRQLPSPALRKALREGARLSKREVAAALGVSPMAVVHWERGSRFPSPAHLGDYAALLQSLQREAVGE
jgi:transcriptional regulator with XRE-family HTH domain